MVPSRLIVADEAMVPSRRYHSLCRISIRRIPDRLGVGVGFQRFEIWRTEIQLNGKESILPW